MHKQWHQNTHPTFTYRKGHIFYFRRKIPSDLRCHYKRPVFVKSLRTTSRSSAQKAAMILAARLDEQWLMLRIKHNQSPASQLLVDPEHKSEMPLISEILECYLETKGCGKAKLFFVHAKRNVGYVISALTYDPDLELLYVGVGNGDPWDRDVRSEGVGDNLFLASIVALNANTGDYVWHYQLNPGEQWDYKATMDMVLADATIDDAPRKVLMQAPTNGFFYVLDRITGELLSAEKYAKATWAEQIDLETGRPVEMPGVRVKPGEKKLIYPSTYGAHNWQPMSYNPDLRLVYIPTIHQGAYHSKPPSYQTRDNFFTIGIVTELAKIDPLDGTGGLLAWDPEAQQPRWRIDNLPIWNGGTLSTAGLAMYRHSRSRLSF